MITSSEKFKKLYPANTRNIKDLTAARVSFFLLVVLYLWSQSSWSTPPDYILQEGEIPDSAAEIRGPLSSGFLKERFEGPFFPRLKEFLKDQHPFIRDTQLEFNFRTYDFDRDRNDTFAADGSNDSRALTTGGELNYRSGFLFERIALGGSYFKSHKIVGPVNEDGTLLLLDGQKSFDVLGEAHALVRFTDAIEFKAYRQSFNLPYLNRRDSRMVPNTHEAYILSGIDTIPDFHFITGYVHKMKTRNIDKFIHMSEVAGFNGTDDGLAMAGLHYHPLNNFSVGAIDYYSINFMNIFYTETNYVHHLTEEIPIAFGAQYTNQKSVGDEFNSNFNRHTGGIQASASYRSAVLTIAATITSDDSDIQSPFGGPPSYLSIIVKNFFRASEDAWLIGLSYDFTNFGIPGLTAYTNYAQGYTPDTGSNASPDQTEWDITIDYRPEHPWLRGLWLRYRRADIDQEGPGATDQVDNRIVLNWSFPLL